jgi:hypothetical protein
MKPWPNFGPKIKVSFRIWINIAQSLAVLLLLTFPFSVQLFIFGYDPTVYKSATTHFVFSLTFYMLYTNKCVNFFVYMITKTNYQKS